MNWQILSVVTFVCAFHMWSCIKVKHTIGAVHCPQMTSAFFLDFNPLPLSLVCFRLFWPHLFAIFSNLKLDILERKQQCVFIYFYKITKLLFWPEIVCFPAKLILTWKFLMTFWCYMKEDKIFKKSLYYSRYWRLALFW